MENTTENCLTSLLDGIAEAMLEDDMVVYYYIKKDPGRYKKLEIVTGLELTKSHHFGACGGGVWVAAASRLRAGAGRGEGEALRPAAESAGDLTPDAQASR